MSVSHLYQRSGALFLGMEGRKGQTETKTREIGALKMGAFVDVEALIPYLALGA